MKGITFYKEDIKRSMARMTDEELGFVFRTFMENIDDEIIPTFEDERLDMLTDGFKMDMEKGIKNAVARRENGSKGGAPRGNQNAAKIKPNTNFDRVVKNYACDLDENVVANKEEVDNDKKEMFLGFLREKKPQTNQDLTCLLQHNASISGFGDTNRINYATQEQAWEEYKNG